MVGCVILVYIKRITKPFRIRKIISRNCSYTSLPKTKWNLSLYLLTFRELPIKPISIVLKNLHVYKIRSLTWRSIYTSYKISFSKNAVLILIYFSLFFVRFTVLFYNKYSIYEDDTWNFCNFYYICKDFTSLILCNNLFLSMCSYCIIILYTLYIYLYTRIHVFQINCFIIDKNLLL